MLKSVQWQMGIVISIIVIGGGLLCRGLMAIQWEPPNAQQVLGIPLPPSTTNLKINVQRPLIGYIDGGYDAYLRFELARDEVATLLADSAFQPTITSKDPFAVLGTAILGKDSMATIAQRERPEWWDIPLEGMYLLAYRSRPSANSSYSGSDSSWYVIDISDPTQAIVYVYAVEV